MVVLGLDIVDGPRDGGGDGLFMDQGQAYKGENSRLIRDLVGIGIFIIVVQIVQTA